VTKRKTLVWALAGLLLLAFLAAISIPNLSRSRKAAYESGFLARSRSRQVVEEQDKQQVQLALVPPSTAEKKLIHNGELGLVVADVHAAAEEIERLTELNHGEIDKVEIVESGGGFLSATLLVRVPASGLENALTQFKKLAVRTEREQVSTVDVTREFYDNEAHLRNLQAEEQQYLAIMKQARTIKDTLEVSEKLSDARDRVERLQTQIQLMTHDIEMSQVNIALTQESEAQVLGIHWRPLYGAKIAVHELLGGLGDWVDWVVAALVKLPLIVLWVLTVGGSLWVVWRIGRSVWLRFFKPKAAENPKISTAPGPPAV